jgi:hypothetical protein
VADEIRAQRRQEEFMPTDETPPTGLLMTFSDPVKGKEAEYDDWYQNVHLPQVCAIPGIRSAQRFRLLDTGDRESGGPRNLAVYQLDDDPQQVFAEMIARARSGALDRSTSIDQSTVSVMLWRANGAPVTV